MRIIIIIVLLLSHAVFAYFTNLAQDVGIDLPEGKLNSLSFAPYRENQGPFDGVFPSTAEVAEDLQLLASKTHTIRTYASYEGTMPAIPPLAQYYGLTMIQGAWLSNDDDNDTKEINALIKAANSYPDVIKRVIVGNEVLLRGEMKVDKLINAIRKVKQAVKQPVSYADVWSIYMKHPQLLKEVDFITIHILPYWEDEPIAAEQAPAHIERIYQLVRQQADPIAGHKPILIGETGWPSAGRQRGWSIPSVVNEAKVVRGLLDVAKKNGFDVNIVEAINQPWKSELEGVVGANWGLFSKDRKEVFPLTGNVYEHPDWLIGQTIAVLLFLSIIAFSGSVLKQLALARMTIYLVFAQVLSALLVYQAEFLWYTSYNNWQRERTVLIIMFSLLLGGLLLRRSLELLSEREFNAPRWLFIIQRHNSVAQQNHLYRISHALIIVFIAYALYQSYGLTLNGRYISFPIIPSAIPIAGLLGLMLIACISQQSWSLKTIELNRLLGYNNDYAAQDKIMGCLLLVLSFGVIVGEIKGFILGGDFVLAYPHVMQRIGMAIFYTLCNSQLLLWLACLLIFAVSLLAGDKTDNMDNDRLSRWAYRKLTS